MQGSAYFPPSGQGGVPLPPIPRFPQPGPGPSPPPTMPYFGRGRGRSRGTWLPQDFVKGRKRPRRRRKLPPRSETTLVCLIKSLVDRRVVVELRNDTLVKAQLDDVDDFLKWVLEEAEEEEAGSLGRGAGRVRDVVHTGRPVSRHTTLPS